MALFSPAASGPLYKYLLSYGVPETDLLRALREETGRLPNASWAMPPEEVAFLQLLVRLTGARRVLELGTFTGYSALAMALALPDDGELVTCDVASGWTEMGTHYWREAGVEKRIDLRIGRAADVLAALRHESGPATFDLALIDADKGGYPDYLDPVAELLRPGSLLVADNVLWGGRVAEPEADDVETAGIRRFNEALSQDSRFRIAMLPFGDGVTLALKTADGDA